MKDFIYRGLLLLGIVIALFGLSVLFNTAYSAQSLHSANYTKEDFMNLCAYHYANLAQGIVAALNNGYSGKFLKEKQFTQLGKKSGGQKVFVDRLVDTLEAGDEKGATEAFNNLVNKCTEDNFNKQLQSNRMEI